MFHHPEKVCVNCRKPRHTDEGCLPPTDRVRYLHTWVCERCGWSKCQCVGCSECKKVTCECEYTITITKDQAESLHNGLLWKHAGMPRKHWPVIDLKLLALLEKIKKPNDPVLLDLAS